MIKLSICVPTYNRLDKLINLLGILSKIDNSQIEILVSDDSSSGVTASFFSSHEFKNIRYYRNHSNMGQFKNCNACIARATGEWIQILHDDDDVDIEYLKTVFLHLDNNALSIISGKSEIIEQNKNNGVAQAHQKKLAAFDLEYDKPMEGLSFKTKILKYGNPLIFSHTIFRRHAAIALGGFDISLKFIGDLDLWLKLLTTGNILILDKNFGSYFLHENNQLAGLDTFVQQSVELMILKIEMLPYFVANASEADIYEYKSYISKNIWKARVFSNMLKTRNSFAWHANKKLNDLIANSELIKSDWSLKGLVFAGIYLWSEVFPKSSFQIYNYLKQNN